MKKYAPDVVDFAYQIIDMQRIIEKQAAPEVEQKPVAILGHDVPLYTHPQPPEFEQEPVAWMNRDGYITLYKQGDAVVPLYTHPQPKREPLTSDRISELWRDACDIIGECDDTVTQLSCAMTFTRLIEKELNK